MSRTWRVLLTIGREAAESRVGHPTDEQYLQTELIYEAVTLPRADHQVRLLTKYATKLGFKVRGRAHSYRQGPET